MPEDRRLAAIMFTDIVGYTALMGSDEDKAFDMLARNHTLHEALIEKHNGTLIKEIGDGTLASFPLASNAVRCALDIQKEAKDQKIPLKIGIHEGEMVMAGSDILGDSVNIASRLQESAEEGCINISGSVYSNIRNKADIQTILIGEKSYKNVGEPIKVYSVLCKGELKKEPKQVWESKKARNKNPYYIIGSFLALIIVLISIWFFSTRQQAIVKESEIEKSIAVLPFKNLSTDVENQYFADGIMDGILNHLSKIKDLRVVSRSSTEKYRENIPQAQQIIKELDVSYYIEGSVFKSEDRILMTAKLLDARNDEHIWSEQYDRELSDLFEVMSEIATKVASEVKVIITPEEKQIIESIPTTNLTAYDFFLRAREEHSKFWLEGDKKALDDATSLYYRALEYDSSFAQAYTGLAFSYGNKLQIEAYFEENFLDSVLILSNKALSFNEYLEEAYYLRSGYLGFIKNELDSAILEINKAIQINPNYAPAYLLKGMLYIANSKDYSQAISNFHKGLGGEDHLFGKQAAFDQLSRAYLEIGFIEKSVFYAKESLKLSTDSSGYLGLLASIQYLQGDFEECSRFYKLDCELDTLRYRYIDNLLQCYIFLENYEEAFKYAQKYISVIDSEGVLVALNTTHRIAYAFWMVGRKEEAKKYFDQQIQYCLETIRLERRFGELRAEYYDLAAVYAFLGEKDKAYQYLEEYDKNAIYSWSMVTLSKRDPLFNSIRNEEKFQTIILNMEAKYQREHERVKAWLEEEGLL